MQRSSAEQVTDDTPLYRCTLCREMLPRDAYGYRGLNARARACVTVLTTTASPADPLITRNAWPIPSVAGEPRR